MDSPKTEPETRIYRQVAYWGSFTKTTKNPKTQKPNKTKTNVGDCRTKKGREVN